MQNKGELMLGTNPNREPFTTIDDLAHLAKEAMKKDLQYL